MLALLVALLSGGFGGFLLATGRDVLKERMARRKRWAFARRLLAHHATTLIEDADGFIGIAERCDELPDAEIAVRFRDARTHEHGYREQLNAYLPDMTDELIDLLRDLDSASAEAATSVSVVQRMSAELFDKMGRMESYAVGLTLREQFDAATKKHRELRRIALQVLEQLDNEHAALPSRAQDSLASSRNARQLTGGTKPPLPKSNESDS